MIKTQPCNRCGKHYGRGGDERRRHQLLMGHTPSPERQPEPAHDPGDVILRERDAMVREARGKGAS